MFKSLASAGRLATISVAMKWYSKLGLSIRLGRTAMGRNTIHHGYTGRNV